ncbi:hypothetical protein [Nitrososphaera sp.]|uniref:hypothetical protein n=1 Tax=Nitrososphaera sp. TaxID=1971748 RepID=UPI00307DADB6
MVSGQATTAMTMRRRLTTLAAVLATAAAASVLAVLLASGPAKDLIENLAVAAASSFASAMAVLAAVSHRKRPGFAPFAALAAGFALWSIAEALWAYLLSATGEIPFPSVTDIPYLAGYVFVAIFLFSLYRALHQPFENRLVAVVAAVTLEAFFLNFFLIQVVESTLGFSQPTDGDWLLLAASLAYPLLDGILLVPAAVLIIAGRDRRSGGLMGRLSLVLLASGVVVFSVADTGFSYFALTDFAALQDEKMWNALYAASYVLCAGSLLSVLLEARDGQKPGIRKAAAMRD